MGNGRRAGGDLPVRFTRTFKLKSRQIDPSHPADSPTNLSLGSFFPIWRELPNILRGHLGRLSYSLPLNSLFDRFPACTTIPPFRCMHYFGDCTKTRHGHAPAIHTGRSTGGCDEQSLVHCRRCRGIGRRRT